MNMHRRSLILRHSPFAIDRTTHESQEKPDEECRACWLCRHSSRVLSSRNETCHRCVARNRETKRAERLLTEWKQAETTVCQHLSSIIFLSHSLARQILQC